MADIYDRGLALAVRMLAPRSKGGKGLALTLLRTQDGVYQGGKMVIPPPVPFDGSGVRTNYKKAEIDGVRVVASDWKLLLSPVTLAGADMPEPRVVDLVSFDGKTYRVISVAPWNYAGLVCGFAVQMRAS